MTAAAAPDAPRSGLGKVVMASLIGTTIEWYDFFLYGTAAALVFNKLFFPSADPLTGAMLAFASYALGFVARPLGGIVFGHFGDRIGRKKLLMLSLVLMGGATFLIGLLPTYGQVGLLAPVLLTLLRLVQGFAVGGEWGGAVLMAAEYGDAKRRGLWAGFPQAGVAAGNLLAAGVLALLAAVQSDEDFLAWGWRIPFLLSAVLIAVGWWVRVSLEESPVFAKAAEGGAHRAPVIEAIRQRPGGVAVGAGLRVGENISYYVITAFSITYIVDVVGLTRSVALNALLIGAAAECLTLPLFAWLSDRIGRRPVYAVGAGGMALFGFAFFPLLETGTAQAVGAAMAMGLILHGAMYGPQAAFIAELFPTRIRYSGASLAYQVTSIVAGSLAPIIAIALFRQSGSATPVAVYMLIACLISLAAALIARETKGQSFEEIDARLSR
ncbi:MFS transporter [Phenylobacterium sp.]|jgi:metabolite-proton symporter|uniref:MFS transporter n=1 Tax=Phenylobacterium sp. TaxID=1871053 RepID=UPI002E3157B3|nr:MFS transporter [Phenylobacterium sp.]HEX2561086.1 MFS transporter [Phenylobacterium sp.]